MGARRHPRTWPGTCSGVLSCCWICKGFCSYWLPKRIPRASDQKPQSRDGHVKQKGRWLGKHIRKRKVLVGAWKHKRKGLYYNKCNFDQIWMKYILASTLSHLIFKGLERVEFTDNFPRWSTACTTSVHVAMSTHDCGQTGDYPSWKTAEVTPYLPKAQVLLSFSFGTLTLGQAQTSQGHTEDFRSQTQHTHGARFSCSDF